MTFHNVIILIKSVVNKNENNYYYNIFLGKASHEDKSNTYFFIINAILNIKNVDYHCIISGISKIEAINVMQNTDLSEKSVTL